MNEGTISNCKIKEELRSYPNNGYSFVNRLMLKVHPNPLKVATTVCPRHLIQLITDNNGSYSESFLYFRYQDANIYQTEHNLGDIHVQNWFVQHMWNSCQSKLLEYTKIKQDLALSVHKDKYLAGDFISTIGQLLLDNDLISKQSSISYAKTSSSDSVYSYPDSGKNFIFDSIHTMLVDRYYPRELKHPEFHMIMNTVPHISEGIQNQSAFDKSQPCAICEEIGHSFDDYSKVQNVDSQKN